ncbi:MAG TPA: RDD family protein [Cytophagales bacterium]|nr:RDD family protein [Cytophagales bacterium]
MAEILDHTTPDDRDLIEATSAQRFVNYFIDLIAVIILGGILSIIFPEILSDEQLSNIIFILLYLAYCSFMEASFGKTLGKFISKTHVVNENGYRPGVMRILGRNLARLIPFDSFSYLFRQRGWHDKASNTYVVKD